MHFACRIAVLVSMKARRRERARKRPFLRDEEFAVESVASEGLTPDAALSSRAMASILRELLDVLPMEQAEALALHCVLGYSIAEIAEACEVPKETVRSRIRASKRTLRARVLGDPRLSDLIEESS